MSELNLRNICIIAHVDHGKTTLIDNLLKQAGTYAAHERIEERVMDSDDQEKERGITIQAKNASFKLDKVKVNIIDTPGHADFGGEVERVMGMVDGAILLVDAVEGPLPQTRFVLQKAIAQKVKIIVCINKVDRSEIDQVDKIQDCVNKVFDLFVELGASDEQCDFAMVYASAKQGWCTANEDDVFDILGGKKKANFQDIFDLVLKLPAPKTTENDFFSMQVSNIMHSDYLGTLAVGRVMSGKAKINDQYLRYGVDAANNPIKQKFQVQKILVFDGLKNSEVDSVEAGDICMIAGCDQFAIGDSLAPDGFDAFARISVEEPTMQMIFSINTTPNSGRDGKAIQSRELKERLIRETRTNVAIKFSETDQSDQFYLKGRGELQFSVIIEKMRRESLEFMVGRPVVIFSQDDAGNKLEPFERVTMDIPEFASGDVTSMFQKRKARLTSFEALDLGGAESRVRLIMEIPTRGMLGTNSKFKTLTRGSGLISSETIGYQEYQGDIPQRLTGSIIADRTGKTTAYSLFSIQQRGQLFVDDGVEVYEGMIIGEGNKDNDINVNAIKPKKLTNIRTSSSDGITVLQGTRKMSLEECLEWIDDDEWIEVTPKNIRLRKKILQANQRSVRREDRF